MTGPRQEPRYVAGREIGAIALLAGRQLADVASSVVLVMRGFPSQLQSICRVEASRTGNALVTCTFRSWSFRGYDWSDFELPMEHHKMNSTIVDQSCISQGVLLCILMFQKHSFECCLLAAPHHECSSFQKKSCFGAVTRINHKHLSDTCHSF